MWWMFWGWFGGGWSQSSKRGDDLKKKITITFDESYLWVTKKITYSRLKVIEWAEKRTCESCNGSGRVVKQIQSPFWVMQTQAACPVCGGSGVSYFKDGKKLHNWWLENTKEVLDIKVPAWIKTDVYLKYSGRWDEWENWMSAWDLYLQINVTSNKDYIRKWEDIYVTQDVSIYDLVLGWEFEIKHPTGKIKIKIPKWTQVDDKIRVGWKGFWGGWLLSKKWDMYVMPNLKIPRRLSKEDEKLWKKLKKG
jgi:molecular chaperone DnaJ